MEMTFTLPAWPPWGFFAAGMFGGLLVGLIAVFVVWGRSRRRLERVESELKHQQNIDAERERALALASEQISNRFGQLAGDHFRTHSEVLLKLARESLSVQNERAKGELAARQQSIESMVRPIREALQKTESRLEQLDRAGRETHGSIKAQLEAMSLGQSALAQETRSLVNALRRPEVRGQWGEITLRRLVELAGMVEHCDFEPQFHQATDQGSVRPDMVINLPENRQLVVDVKTPLDAYLEATESDKPDIRAASLKRHASIVAGRIRELSTKSYWTQFDQSPEFVILFIPGDQFLSAALAERPELLDDALRQNIILATPSSFIALLKAVAYGWQQVKLAESASEIRTLAAQLYERLAVFSKHLAGVGKALTDSVKAYNKGVGSLERMVLPSARKFTELGIQPRQPIPDLPKIEEPLREVAEGSPDSDLEPDTKRAS